MRGAGRLQPPREVANQPVSPLFHTGATDEDIFAAIKAHVEGAAPAAEPAPVGEAPPAEAPADAPPADAPADAPPADAPTDPPAE